MPFDIFPGQLPLLGAHRAGKEAKDVDGRRQVVIKRLMQWFAAVERLQTGQALGLTLDGIGNTQQNSRAVGGGSPRPGSERLLRRFHCVADLDR
ncbi:hypothetical protein D3C78_1391430 [compost metagenome]